jgi:hypothetical protein
LLLFVAIVVLSGGHSVGHVHTQFSGFGFAETASTYEKNPQTNAWDETPFLFDNEYYDSLAEEVQYIQYINNSL